MSWNGTKVLVTGADGFIGSHLTEELVQNGADVRAFCLYNSNSSLGWLDESPAAVRDAITPLLGDIRDTRFVEESCEGVEVVFHLAALIAIPYSYRAPESFVDTNVRGTLNVLEGVHRQKCQRLVQTSTSEVYGTPDHVPITEDHPLKAQSPYSASKIGADKLCEAYFRSFEVPVVTLRPFNTYGPRQSARAVIPTILAQLLSGQRTISLGSLEPRRDMTFVSDTVDGFLAAGSTPGVEGETIQLGTGRSESIGDIFDTACRVLSVEACVDQDQARVRPPKSEVMILHSDPSRARERLGWEARVSLEQGLSRIAEWIRKKLHRFELSSFAI